MKRPWPTCEHFDMVHSFDGEIAPPDIVPCEAPGEVLVVDKFHPPEQDDQDIIMCRSHYDDYDPLLMSPMIAVDLRTMVVTRT